MTWKIGSPRATRNDGLELLDQLEGLLAAGLPLDRALQILAGTIDIPPARALVFDLQLHIQKGGTFADALGKHPAVFSALDVSMIRAGEEGGVLEAILRRLVDYQRSRQDFLRYLATSAIYPIVLLVFGIVAVGGILIFVLPPFVESYGDMSKANAAARLLFALSDILMRNGWMLLLGAGIAAGGLKAFLDTSRGTRWLQGVLLRSPGAGNIIVKAELSRVLHTVGILLGAGVPILVALRLGRALTPFADLDAAFADAEKSLREGRGFSRPMQAHPIIPSIVGQLARVGEESGALGEMLIKVAQRLELEVRSKLRTVMAILEPVMIIGIGLIIGGIVVAMISAIFSLNEMSS
ncbi:MAG: type II secretion system F family protein [Sulfurisoma sp.]|nr:type II secretion system F family protein [Sulfurisoma sp.]